MKLEKKQKTTRMARVGMTAAAAAVAALVGAQAGCGMFGGGDKEQTMHASSSSPAAQGTVKTSVADNGNTALSVRVKHLAPPSKMGSDATVYVVWLQPGDAAIQNMGAMTLNDDLEGRLDTVTPHQRFTLSVTPEPGAQGAQPTHEAVFTTSVEGRN
jgi:hypothetical protein